jgi:alcohol dehydrogenase class IV
VTKNSVFDSPEANVKASIRSNFMLPALAVVDPLLTVGVPSDVTAATGLDALTQCLEPYVCNACVAAPRAMCTAAELTPHAPRSSQAQPADGCHFA